MKPNAKNNEDYIFHIDITFTIIYAKAIMYLILIYC